MAMFTIVMARFPVAMTRLPMVMAGRARAIFAPTNKAPKPEPAPATTGSCVSSRYQLPLPIHRLHQDAGSVVHTIVIGGRHRIGPMGAREIVRLLKVRTQGNAKRLGPGLGGLQRRRDGSLQQQEGILAIAGEGTDRIRTEFRDQELHEGGGGSAG